MTSSLMLTEPGRFATAQRMAQAFAQSAMVPEPLRGNMPNCLVALMLADEMGESPLMVMQNVYFVSGRPGWQAQYMISRANRSGAFKGPLTWETAGSGADLEVTCRAVLRNEDGTAGERVEVTVSMAMARADGWTRNEKYKSLPEQMLRWRSATWLIRLHRPDVMFGLPTVDELEDTMKDVTPPKLRIDDFKPGGHRKPPAPVIDHAAQGPGEAAAAFNVVDAEGVEHSYDDPESAYEAMMDVIQDRSPTPHLAGWWRDNMLGRAAIALDGGRPDLVDLLNECYAEELPKRAAAAAEPADEPAAPVRQQEPEPASPQPAPVAAARVALFGDPPSNPPPNLAEIIPAKGPGRTHDWTGWRKRFEIEARRCAGQVDFAVLIGNNHAQIAAYNRALPRAAAQFEQDRAKRKEELPNV